MSSNDFDNQNPYAASAPIDHPSPGFGNPVLDSANPPKVLYWVQVYNTLMVLLYVVVTVAGVLMVLYADQLSKGMEDQDPMGLTIAGYFYAVLGAVFALLYAVGIVWRRGNGAWVYQLVLILIGLTGCITWPATIPLIIYWIKDRERIVRVK